MSSQKPLSLDEASLPSSEEPTADVRAWQEKKIERAVNGADRGRFASPEAVKMVIQKYVSGKD